MEKYTCAQVSNSLLQKYLSVACAATLLNNTNIQVSVAKGADELTLITELGQQGNIEKVEISKSFENVIYWTITWEINRARTILESINGTRPRLTIIPNVVCLIDETLEENLEDITKYAMSMKENTIELKELNILGR